MTITLKVSSTLLSHLMTYEVDGGSVGTLLFEAGGRLSYPGRADLERLMGYPEPYTLEHECRTVQGLSKKTASAIRFLAGAATLKFKGFDPTLDMLWGVHDAYSPEEREGPSVDRVVAALVMVEHVSSEHQVLLAVSNDVYLAALLLVQGMHAAGFPPTQAGLESLFDGAEPACCGLGLVEI